LIGESKMIQEKDFRRINFQQSITQYLSCKEMRGDNLL